MRDYTQRLEQLQGLKNAGTERDWAGSEETLRRRDLESCWRCIGRLGGGTAAPTGGIRQISRRLT
jgi:hypothetical protein